MMKKKAGRPPLPAGARHSAAIMVRVTNAELRMLKALAKRKGVSLAALLMKQWRAS